MPSKPSTPNAGIAEHRHVNLLLSAALNTFVWLLALH
jgi:hypothetical protein